MAALVARRPLARPVPLQRCQERGSRLQRATRQATALGVARRRCTADAVACSASADPANYCAAAGTASATAAAPERNSAAGTAASLAAAAGAAWRRRRRTRPRARARQRCALLQRGRHLRCGADFGSRQGPLAAARLLAWVHGVNLRMGTAISSWLCPRHRRGRAAVRERGGGKGVREVGVQSCCCACLRPRTVRFDGACRQC